MPKIKSYPKYRKYANKVNSNQQIEENLKDSLEEEEELNIEANISRVKTSKKVKGDYSIFWFGQFGQNSWKPDAREGQSFVLDGKSAYMFGGVGKE